MGRGEDEGQAERTDSSTVTGDLVRDSGHVGSEVSPHSNYTTSTTEGEFFFFPTNSGTTECVPNDRV